MRRLGRRSARVQVLTAIGIAVAIAAIPVALISMGGEREDAPRDFGGEVATSAPTSMVDAATAQAVEAWRRDLRAAAGIDIEMTLTGLVAEAANELGGRGEPGFRDRARAAVEEFRTAHAALGGLAPLPQAPAAGALATKSAAMALAAGRIYVVLADAEDPAVQAQLDLAARRLRELSTRLGSRVDDVLRPLAGEPEPVGPRPEAVPDWEAEGLLPGPPIAPEPPPPADYPPTERDLGTQEVDAWRADVAAAGAPDVAPLMAAIDAGDAAALGAFGTTFVDAADALRTTAAPRVELGLLRARLIRTAWLVYAEAARVAQLASYVASPSGSDEMYDVARALAADGSELAGLFP